MMMIINIRYFFLALVAGEESKLQPPVASQRPSSYVPTTIAKGPPLPDTHTHEQPCGSTVIRATPKREEEQRLWQRGSPHVGGDAPTASLAFNCVRREKRGKEEGRGKRKRE